MVVFPGVLYITAMRYDLVPHGRGERTVDFVYSSVYLKLQSDGVLTGHGGWRGSWSRIGQSPCWWRVGRSSLLVYRIPAREH